MTVSLQRTLQDVAHARRLELIPYVYQCTGGRVQKGPFEGMVITPRVSWGDGDTAAKLLGVYEDELHPWILDAVASKPDLLLNIGCAEGYYAVGICRLLPFVPALAVDINLAAKNAVAENILANVINGLDVLIQNTDCAWLEDRCSLPEKPLIIMDCESAELELLDLNKVPSLSKCRVIVECHDCQIPGITETLIERFRATHRIEQVSQRTKDPYQFDFLHELSDCDKWCLVQEGRPSTMTWLYMIPR